jgi:hypothetical protein
LSFFSLSIVLLLWSVIFIKSGINRIILYPLWLSAWTIANDKKF